MTEEINYRLLKLLEQKPDISQRELSRQLGVSLGKVNYCLNSLVEKGWVMKVRNFKNSGNKLAYAYLLTPDGIEEKARVTLRFLQRKLAEHEHIQREIAELRYEVERGRRADNGQFSPG
jgi:EPS-associated MarR family transcriptional regulator